MDIKKYEDRIKSELSKVIKYILSKYPRLNIPAKSRAGAEISNFLEEQFVTATTKNKYFKNSEASPMGATKHPWDSKTYFCLNDHEEVIWIDFKAVKVSGSDSNPDIGTPNKMINLISEGSFYLIYVFVYYSESNGGLKFVNNSENENVKIYFLKDISSTFRRNPKNQLQVNISKKSEYRTREDFIKLLYKKIEESHKRQINISKKALKKITEQSLFNSLIEINRKSEKKIKKI